MRGVLFLLALTAPTLAWARDPVGREVDVEVPIPAKPAPEDAGGPARLRVGIVAVLGLAQPDGDRLAKYLSKQLNVPAEAVVFQDYDAVANALVKGSIEMAWLPPMTAWNAKLGGAKLLVKLIRKGEAGYRLVFFTRADSPFQTLKDVKDARVAWVNPSSASGYVFALATLSRDGLTKSQLFKDEKFLGNHDAVCEAVARKDFDVGATFADEPAEGQPPTIDGCKHALGKKVSTLKVLAMSDKVPSDVIAVRRGLDPALSRSLKKVLLGLPANEDGRKLLSDVLKAGSTSELTPNDFLPIEKALEQANAVQSQP